MKYNAEQITYMLVDADNEVYAQGFEDGMAAQAEVQKTLRPWVGLTDEEVKDIVWNLPYEPSQEHIRAIEAKLKEKNT